MCSIHKLDYDYEGENLEERFISTLVENVAGYGQMSRVCVGLCPCAALHLIPTLSLCLQGWHGQGGLEEGLGFWLPVT